MKMSFADFKGMWVIEPLPEKSLNRTKVLVSGILKHALKRRRAQPGDKWHLDEVFLTINGKRHYLWRAVDQDDHVLDIPHSTRFSGNALSSSRWS
jgi:transposase-like protein